MELTSNRKMTKDAQTVSGWDFDKIIMCHGVSAFLVYS
jgi:hypothetical protein